LVQEQRNENIDRFTVQLTQMVGGKTGCLPIKKLNDPKGFQGKIIWMLVCQLEALEIIEEMPLKSLIGTVRQEHRLSFISCHRYTSQNTEAKFPKQKVL
jgi:hypothetical protein